MDKIVLSVLVLLAMTAAVGLAVAVVMYLKTPINERNKLPDRKATKKAKCLWISFSFVFAVLYTGLWLLKSGDLLHLVMAAFWLATSLIWSQVDAVENGT